MYAVILSEQEDISFEELRAEIRKEGFEVLGSELETVEDDTPVPPNVILWVLWGWRKPVLYPNFPMQKMVRVISPSHPDNVTLFRVYHSPWWARLYYSLLMKGLFVWTKWKRSLEIGRESIP